MAGQKSFFAKEMTNQLRASIRKNVGYFGFFMNLSQIFCFQVDMRNNWM